jgi:sialate O-acetylesterase
MNPIIPWLPRCVFFVVTSVLFSSRSVVAEVKMPAIFGDHMVLQQGQKVPVWGTADPGEKVTVIVGDHAGGATADDKGKWRIDLAPFPPSSTTYAMIVMGRNMIRYEDVMIGDVWIASGQSNMEFSVHDCANFKDISDHLDDQLLRVFQADHAYALEPNSEIRGHWEIASLASLEHFSAVAYFFGHELRGHVNQPIGLVDSCLGGTVAQSWTSISGLQKDPPFTNYIDAHDKAVADFPALSDGYADKVVAFQKADREWRDKYETDYWKIWGVWQTQAQLNRIAGKPVPPEPHFDHPPAQQPADPFGGPNAPGNLYNGMIAPLIPFAIKGVIWYQGEYNAGDSVEYRTLFPRLITDWREKWGQGDFPFLFVQLAVPFASTDLRVGGKYRIQMKKADGEFCTAVGEFREVRAPERLVYTWDFEKDGAGEEFGEREGKVSLITVEFFRRGKQTEFVLTHTRFATVESRDSHARGWGRIADSFANFVEKE